jgi:hypothetical protein
MRFYGYLAEIVCHIGIKRVNRTYRHTIYISAVDTELLKTRKSFFGKKRKYQCTKITLNEPLILKESSAHTYTEGVYVADSISLRKL